MKRNGSLVTVALLSAGAMYLSAVGPVFAHGSVDQSHTSPIGGASQILAFEPIGQEFTPTHASLTGVEFLVGPMNPQFGAETLTVRLRQGTITSTVLASSSQNVPSDFGDQFHKDQQYGQLHFDFPGGVSVVAGQKYVLELQANKGTHGWLESGSDSYLGGAVILQGNVTPDDDLLFLTYNSAAAPVPAMSQWGLLAMASVIAGILLLHARRRAVTGES